MGLLDRFRKGPRVQRVRPLEAHALIQEGALFLDVRNRREFKQGHAEGARNLALNTLPNAVRTLDPERPVVCICQSGARSGRAAQFLVRNGFQEVYNVGGGSAAWHRNGLPWE